MLITAVASKAPDPEIGVADDGVQLADAETTLVTSAVVPP